jgi:hypothetical protein
VSTWIIESTTASAISTAIAILLAVSSRTRTTILLRGFALPVPYSDEVEGDGGMVLMGSDSDRWVRESDYYGWWTYGQAKLSTQIVTDLVVKYFGWVIWSDHSWSLGMSTQIFGQKRNMARQWEGRKFSVGFWTIGLTRLMIGVVSDGIGFLVYAVLDGSVMQFSAIWVWVWCNTMIYDDLMELRG